MTDLNPAARLDMDIPESAREHLFTCGCRDPRCNRAGYQEAALPLVVAAELRRLAALVSEDEDEASFSDFLLERADELGG